MKTRILSFLLVVATLVSLLGVFTTLGASAADTDSTKSTSNTVKEYVHVRYSFGDGYDDVGAISGLQGSSKSSFTTKVENGNKYGHLSLLDSANIYFTVNANTKYSPSSSANGYLIYEMDINDLGNLLEVKRFVDIISGEGNARAFAQDVVNIGNDGKSNYIYAFNSTSKKIYLEKNTWNTVRIEMCVASANAKQYQCTVRLGDKSYTYTYNLGTPDTINSFRIGTYNCINQVLGIDNITLYSSPELLDSYRDIAGVSSALVMKVGSDNALMFNQKINIANAPIMINSEAYCPVDVLTQYAGGIITDQYNVSINDVEYIAVSDVKAAFGKEVTYDTMGLIIVSTQANLLNRNDDLDLMIDLTERFVYDLPSAESVLEDVVSNSNLQHPYIIADAERFSTLADIYSNGKAGKLTDEEELTLYAYISQYLTTASKNYNTWANSDSNGNYIGLKKKPENSNYDQYSNNGYDVGGRLSVPSSVLVYWAFAYQVTGEIKYAKLSYDYSLALGEWNHWGPDHFLNCADASYPFAIAYDWLYNAYEDLRKNNEFSPYSKKAYNQAEIAEILFTHGIVPGYVSSMGGTCAWPGIVGGSKYYDRTNNWNAVCTSGMVIAALALVGEDLSATDLTFDIQTKNASSGYTTHYDTPLSEIGNKSIHEGMVTYSDYATALIEMNLKTLMLYGMDQSYVLDGSYVESPSYWSYGTNSLFRMIAALVTATGTDYGFMDACGIDRTCYFALHSESSDYQMWNYHDGNSGQQDTSSFLFVGAYYGDDNLVLIRKLHLENGKSISFLDLLYYDTKIVGEPDMALDYQMEAIDGYAVRSSWDKGAIYAGLIGGDNNVSHGQIDAGTFVYHSNGTIWFCDLGVDQYNYAGGYFSNYTLYRLSAEGHNVICLADQADVPYGQIVSSISPIIKTGSDGADGSYSILNTTAAYGQHVVSAKRGILFTNSRTTTVIQDEIVFNGEKTVYWLGHYSLSEVDEVILSGDGRTAYMTKDGNILRVSIVSDNEDLTFEIMDAYTYLLNATIRTDVTTVGGAKTEYSRADLRKLVIKCENVTSLNLAVVIESVDSYTAGANYTWTNMSNWDPASIETEATNTNVYIDYDNSSEQVGNTTLTSKNDIYKLIKESGSNKFATLYATADTRANPELVFSILPQGNATHFSNQTKFAVIDLDLLATNEFPEGLTFTLNVKNAVGDSIALEIFKFNGSDIVFGEAKISTNNKWGHITIVCSKNDKTIYVYYNGEFVGKANDILTGDIVKINSVDFSINSYVNCATLNSVSMDNFVLRTFGTSYDSASLSAILNSDGDISGWSDSVYSSDSVSQIAPLAIIEETNVYTYAEIEAAIAAGKTVILQRDCLTKIKIEGPGTIITNGYKFDYSSEQYLAHITDGTIAFNSDSVTVTWHIGNKIYTEQYFSSSVATFKISVPEINSITEKTRVATDGTIRYEYYTTAWAASPNGKSLSDGEMIVTSENCEFWLVYNAPVTSLYMIKDADGNVTPGTDISGLAEAITSSDSSVHSVILCSNVDLSVRGLTKLSTTEKHIYLNGYTITHIANSHLFWFRNDSQANIYFHGPGTINKGGSSSASILTSDASTTDKTVKYGVMFENITMFSERELFDVRIGQHKYINCTMTQNAVDYTSSLNIWNKNENNPTANIVTVTLEGCKISRNSPKSSNVFNIIGFGEYIVKDCEVINPEGLLFNTDCNTAKLVITGETYIAMTTVMSNEKVSTGVSIDKGVRFTNEPESVTYDTDAYEVAKADNVKYPYIICEGTVTVIWADIDKKEIAREVFAKGYSPALTNETVVQYLKKLNAETGLNYGYELVAVPTDPSIKYKRYELQLLEESDIQMNVTLNTMFDINVYIPQDYAVTASIGDTIYTINELETKVIDGKTYYQLTIAGITPANIGSVINVLLVDEFENESTVAVSFVDYINTLKDSEQTRTMNTMIANMLKYISAAYTYAGKTTSSEYSDIQDLLSYYEVKAGIFSAQQLTYCDLTQVSNAITSATLNLLSSPTMMFALSSDYTGKVTLAYNGSTYEFDVVNGMVSGSAYISIALSVDALGDDIIITTDSGSANYNFNAYCTAVNSGNESLANLLFWLYNYYEAAKAYAQA